FFEETVGKLAQLGGLEPRAIAHDLHPDYRSTRWARGSGLPLVPVQHHHAHIASCLVEHGRSGLVLGVAFDGTGFGPDGPLWCGVIRPANLGSCRRRGHRSPLPPLGGECAIRAPWRLAAAALLEAGEPVEQLVGMSAAGVEALRQIWSRPHLAPRATGA